MTAAATVPDPALVVLIGPAGSGKSTWAATRYRAQEIVSSDDLRGVVGSGPHDLEASDDALGLLDSIVASRVRRGLSTVVDTLGLDAVRRRDLLAVAKRAGLPAVAVLMATDPAVCRRRNRTRDRAVPAAVLDAQLARMAQVVDDLDAEPWDVLVHVTGDSDHTGVEPRHSPGARQAAAEQRDQPKELGFVLQLSRFPWDTDPVSWLADVASTAADVGFEGIALMDHLIQIPQVGRAWEPIPEPYATLGFLAGLCTGGDFSLRLGTLVTPVTFRAPGIVAKSVATLDVLTGGRAFCGIGAGWWEREHAAYGLAMPQVSDRMDLLETAIETMRALWGPGTKAYAGKRVTLPETTCYPRPVSSIPIIVGGGGERRTLEIAARLGDGCNVSADLDTLDRKLEVLRRHCLTAGRDPEEVAVTVLDLPVVGRDRDDAALIVERLRGRTSAAVFARHHHAGTAIDHVGRYRLLAEKGVSTVFVALPDLTGQEQLHHFAPVLSAFA